MKHYFGITLCIFALLIIMAPLSGCATYGADGMLIEPEGAVFVEPVVVEPVFVDGWWIHEGHRYRERPVININADINLRHGGGHVERQHHAPAPIIHHNRLSPPAIRHHR